MRNVLGVMKKYAQSTQAKIEALGRVRPAAASCSLLAYMDCWWHANIIEMLHGVRQRRGTWLGAACGRKLLAVGVHGLLVS